MPRRERIHGRHATLYAREDLPRPVTRRRDAVVVELAAATENGTLDAFDVVLWNKRVPVAGEATRERALAEEFRRWAVDAEASLAPCFDTRRCYDESTGRKRTELVLPALCLAVSEDEELTEVAPHATGEGVVTVADCLERLADGDFEETRNEETIPTAD